MASINVARAQSSASKCGINERSLLICEALKALVQRESSRRLAALGGSEPQLEAIPRRLAY